VLKAQVLQTCSNISCHAALGRGHSPGEESADKDIRKRVDWGGNTLFLEVSAVLPMELQTVGSQKEVGLCPGDIKPVFPNSCCAGSGGKSTGLGVVTSVLSQLCHDLLCD
jgi:predicted CxxxxCH...CXXCH cytochrome family protein